MSQGSESEVTLTLLLSCVEYYGIIYHGINSGHAHNNEEQDRINPKTWDLVHLPKGKEFSSSRMDVSIKIYYDIFSIIMKMITHHMDCEDHEENINFVVEEDLM